jgi:hypothetical protein
VEQKMMEKLLIDQVWIPIVLCAVIYLVDYYLGLYEAYLYHNHAKAHVVFDERYEGYERVSETGNRKWIPSSSFFVVLVVVSLGIYAAWYALVKQFARPELFLLILGGLILFRAASTLIHFRTVSLFRFTMQSGEIKGKVMYSKHMTSTLLYLDFYGFTLLYLLLLFIQGGWFLFGGILTCFIAARRHRDWVMVKT